MPTFGRRLLERGIVAPEQLEKVTESLVVFGGRLGTHLVESGLLSVEELERCLAEHIGVSTPPPEWLRDPEPAALAAVPRALVERLKVLPIRCHGGILHVAARDPQNPHLVDEISLATGLWIKTYLISEIRLFFLLERHYGIDRNQRYVDLTSGGAPGGEVFPEVSSAPASEGSGEPCGPADEPPPELIDEDSFTSLYAGFREAARPLGDAASKPEATTPSAGVARLERELARAQDRDAVMDAALSIALGHAAAAALFVCPEGMIQGSRAGGEARQKNVESILVSSDGEGLLGGALATGLVCRGAPAANRIDAHVVRHLRRGDPFEVLVFPIPVRERVVNLLYVDNGPEPVGESSIAALGVLCQRMSQAYERIILARKRRDL